MIIFIYEHICGGGLAREKLPAKLVAQGGAMMGALVHDMVALGHDVLTTLDVRIEIDLPDCQLTPVLPRDDIFEIFDELAGAADATLIIAPEEDKMLSRLIRRSNRLTTRSLNCTADAAELCGDKLRLGSFLSRAGLLTPTTYTAGSVPPDAFPVVLKPRDGAGCEHTRICHGPEDLLDRPVEEMICQPWIEGVAASCSVIVNNGRVVPLLAGRQIIETHEDQLHYRGGEIPLDEGRSARAQALAVRAAHYIPGLRGFVGVDVILADDPADDCVIEVNPRVTVSYLGLRQLSAINLGQVLLDPDRPTLWKSGCVQFDAAGHVVFDGIDEDSPLIDPGDSGMHRARSSGSSIEDAPTDVPIDEGAA